MHLINGIAVHAQAARISQGPGKHKLARFGVELLGSGLLRSE